MAIGVINKNVVVVVALKDTGKNDPTDKAYHGGGKNNNKSVDTMTATKYKFKKKMTIINGHHQLSWSCIHFKKKKALAIVVTITTMKKIWTTEATERNNNCCTAVSPIANNPF